MNILVVFATKRGQTQRIAEYAAARIRARGHSATLHNSIDGAQDIVFHGFDAVVIASAVYRVMHHESIVEFVATHRAALQEMPSALVSVSLSVVLPDGRPDADTYANVLMANTQWNPDWTLLIGGSLCLAEKENMNPDVAERIFAEQRETTGAVQDFDFTDWDLLSQFSDDFVAMAEENAMGSKTPQNA